MKIGWIMATVMTLLIADSCRKAAEKERKAEPTVMSVRGIGKIIPEGELLTLSAPTGGVIEEIVVEENDTILAGDLILKLNQKVVRQDQEAIMARERSLIQELQKVAAQKEEALKNVSHQKRKVERIRKLRQTGAASGQQLEDEELLYAQYEAQLKQLHAEQDKINYQIEETKAELSGKEQTAEERSIRAPQDGVVLDIDAEVGEYIAADAGAVTFFPHGKLIARCEIDELYAHKIKVGQKAYLLSVGGADTLAAGKVIYTSLYLKPKSQLYEQVGEPEDRRVLEVEILPNHPEGLLINSKVECSILVPLK